MMRALNTALDRIGAAITSAVGTMWCAIVFAGLALISLPAALHSHDALVIVSWTAQTLLQLVLLPVIMVGQNQASRSSEALIQDTHKTVLGILRSIHATTTATHHVVSGQPAGELEPSSQR